MDITSPPGSNWLYTLTQRSSDCKRRLVDSNYVSSSSYDPTNGNRNTVFVPYGDVSGNIDGGKFDFVHMKDTTLVNMRPVGATFYIHRMAIRGTCPKPCVNGPMSKYGFPWCTEKYDGGYSYNNADCLNYGSECGVSCIKPGDEKC